VLASCRLDVLAIKPGNVSLPSPGHGMTATDFLTSAEAVAPILSAPGLSLGRRVLMSVEATRRAVGCNTNLGIVLLCAPLAQAALEAGVSRDWGPHLRAVLQALDVEDARDVFRAIVLAAPAGLGQSGRHDVHEAPEVGLLDAMAEAASRDRIAYQYAHDYADVRSLGLPCLHACASRWAAREDRLEWATVACYLAFLARIPDTHLLRKHGPDEALKVRREAERVETGFKACENPANAIALLQDFDNKLKRGGLNPGTSADLTVASLLAFHLDRPWGIKPGDQLRGSPLGRSP
jgi:triphosphoribosyl-dephospho-CoA synthase